MNDTGFATNSKQIALVPAYEPEEIMIELLKQLKDKALNVIIVDDGSGDAYSDLFKRAEEYGTVLVHPQNMGKGCAIKTGLKYIYGHFEAPYTVVTVDADGQHRIDDVMRVCARAGAEPDALVLGSRKFNGKVPLRSRFGNTVTRFVFRISSGKKVYDTQTGLRAFSDKLLPRLTEIDGERYEYEMNVLMQFSRDDIPIREEWIETVYIDDNSSTHFDTIRDSWKIYKEILKFSGVSLISFCVDYSLYCILNAVTGQLLFSNVTARIVSATVNYTLNRKMVFNSKAPVLKSVLQYIALAVFIIACNSALLKLLTGIGLNKYLIKIPVELAMFIVSWSVQHLFIFGTEENAKSGESNQFEEKSGGKA